MFSMVLLLAINTWLLLSPSVVVAKLLTLMDLPMAGRVSLLIAAVLNVVISLGFERWGTLLVSDFLGRMAKLWNLGGRGRNMGGKAYKAVENGFH